MLNYGLPVRSRPCLSDKGCQRLFGRVSTLPYRHFANTRWVYIIVPLCSTLKSSACHSCAGSPYRFVCPSSGTCSSVNMQTNACHCSSLLAGLGNPPEIASMNKTLPGSLPTISPASPFPRKPRHTADSRITSGFIFTKPKEEYLVRQSAAWQTYPNISLCPNVLITGLFRSFPFTYSLGFCTDRRFQYSFPPTTPNCRLVCTELVWTLNKLVGTFAPSSQPIGSTQRALQASLTGNIVFANEAIVDTVFQPSKVDDQTIMDILTEINTVKLLKTARNKVLSKKLAETKKYEPMVRHQMSGCL